MFFFFFSSRRRHTILQGDWSSDVCSSDLGQAVADQEDVGCWYAESPDGGLEDPGIGFAIPGLAGDRDAVEIGENVKTAHHRVDAIVEVRDHSDFYAEPLEV